jgi:hypothetical protein
MKANPFASTGHILFKPLDLIHMDVHGPVPVQSHSGHRYYTIFVDDCIKFKVTIPMKKKSDTFAAFLSFQALAENQFKDTIGAIQDDKGGNLCPRSFMLIVIKEGLCVDTLCIIELSRMKVQKMAMRL